MLEKFAFVSLATALANKVLPVPGGPWRSTPFGASTPSLSKSSGYRRGSSIISLTFRISSVNPPISSYVIRGTSVAKTLAGFSLRTTWVDGTTITAAAGGWNPVTIRFILRPMIPRGRRSPLEITRFSRICLRYSSPPVIRSGSVGAIVIFFASLASTFLMSTFSSMPVPALFLV